MQEFKMPWDEIMMRFTASELAMMNFSARESVADLGKDRPKLKMPTDGASFLEGGVGNPDAMQYSEFSTKRGAVEVGDEEMVDMRNFKGAQLANYFQKQGLAFPQIFKKKKAD